MVPYCHHTALAAKLPRGDSAAGTATSLLVWFITAVSSEDKGSCAVWQSKIERVESY